MLSKRRLADTAARYAMCEPITHVHRRRAGVRDADRTRVMSLAEQISSTKAMQDVFSPDATVRAMLEVEAALAQAGASTGLIPQAAAAAITTACIAARLDSSQLATDAALAGTIIVPLVEWLKFAVPDHAKSVHLGGTSQDVIDTALVLQLRAGIALLQSDLAQMASATAALAVSHAATPMAGRTLLQSALPITFGLKAANWLTAIDDSRRAIHHAARESLCLQCGGATGTLDALGDHARAFLPAYAGALSLPLAPSPWHTNRAPLVRLAAAIAAAVGVAGKIGTDIALLMQPEFGEISEPAATGRGSSSAMTHKRNPTLSITARAAALRMPGYVATLLAAQDQEHERAAGAWQAEAATWPALMLCASAGLAAMAEALTGLEIHPARMAENLIHLPAAVPAPTIADLIAQALAAHARSDTKLDTS